MCIGGNMETATNLKRSNRHYVTVTVEDVIVAIGELAKDSWTTRDVAAALGVKEQDIRATIHQLKIRRLIREAGRVRRLTKETAKEYRQGPVIDNIVLPGKKKEAEQ